MKKITALTLLFFVLLTLFSCGGKQNEEKNIGSLVFDFSKKERDPYIEVKGTERAYVTRDNEGNSLSFIVDGEELISEQVTDKHGKVLFEYTREFFDAVKRPRIEDGTKPRITVPRVYTVGKSYVYNEDGLLIKQIHRYSSYTRSSDDDESSPDGLISLIRRIAEKMINIGSGSDDDYFFAYDENYYVYLPYIDEFYCKTYDDVIQYELEYGYKNGVRYVTSASYDTDYYNGVFVNYKYDDNGICTVIRKEAEKSKRSYNSASDAVYEAFVNGKGFTSGYDPIEKDGRKTRVTSVSVYKYAVKDNAAETGTILNEREYAYRNSDFDSEPAETYIAVYDGSGREKTYECRDENGKTRFYIVHEYNGNVELTVEYTDRSMKEVTAREKTVYDEDHPDVDIRNEYTGYENGKEVYHSVHASEAVEFDGEYIPVTVYYFKYENGVLTSLYKVEEDENSAAVFKNYVYEDGSYTVSVYRDDTLISEETFDGNIPENEVPQN